MAEWLKAHAWKACKRETVSRVRIPLSPPFFNSLAQLIIYNKITWSSYGRQQMKKFIIIFLLGCLLSSCASRDEKISKYRSWDERKLCMSFLLNENSNIWQDERLMVIEEKGHNCDRYIPEANLRINQRKQSRTSSGSSSGITSCRCAVIHPRTGVCLQQVCQTF